MPRLIVSIDGVVVKEVQLTKDRSTIGRRPYNDIVIDNLAVSGEHAVIHLAGGQATLEDLGSTNGTFVNGKSIKKQLLAHEDSLEVGKYKIRFLEGEQSASGMASLQGVPSGMGSPSRVQALGADMPATEPAWIQPPAGARVRVLNGAGAGREMPLTKVVTTIGKPGLSVASITRRSHGFDLAHVEGEQVAAVNSISIDDGPITLKNRDRIDLGGIRLEFVDR